MITKSVCLSQECELLRETGFLDIIQETPFFHLLWYTLLPFTAYSKIQFPILTQNYTYIQYTKETTLSCLEATWGLKRLLCRQSACCTSSHVKAEMMRIVPEIVAWIGGDKKRSYGMLAFKSVSSRVRGTLTQVKAENNQVREPVLSFGFYTHIHTYLQTHSQRHTKENAPFFLVFTYEYLDTCGKHF